MSQKAKYFHKRPLWLDRRPISTKDLLAFTYLLLAIYILYFKSQPPISHYNGVLCVWGKGNGNVKIKKKNIIGISVEKEHSIHFSIIFELGDATSDLAR